jgi:glycosyltransferase involved in cell wall biosynthesis
VRSIFFQSYPNWELILIDDGSTDLTVSVARRFRDPRIQFLADGKRVGHGTRLNQAIDLSKGKYLARMDGDDICFPERLEHQVRYLEEHPKVDVLGTGAIVFAEGGIAKGVVPFRQSHSDICRRPWAGFYLPHPTWMGKIEWFRKHRYGVDVFRAEDQELLLRTFDISTFACLPEVLLGYRQGALSVRKIAPARFSFSKSLVREYARRKKYGLAVIAPLAQAGRALIDILAISSGLSRFLLRRRALPVGEAEISKWEETLVMLQMGKPTGFADNPDG